MDGWNTSNEFWQIQFHVFFLFQISSSPNIFDDLNSSDLENLPAVRQLPSRPRLKAAEETGKCPRKCHESPGRLASTQHLNLGPSMFDHPYGLPMVYDFWRLLGKISQLRFFARKSHEIT